MVSVPDCLDKISVVLQLLSQLESSGPPPASKTTIDSLPTTSINQSQIGKLLSFALYYEFSVNKDKAILVLSVNSYSASFHKR